MLERLEYRGNLYAAGQGPSLSTGLTQPFCSLLSLEDNSRSKFTFEGLPAIQLLLIQHTSGPPDDIMGIRVLMEVCLDIGFIWLRMIMHEKNVQQNHARTVANCGHKGYFFLFSALDILSLFVVSPNKINFVTSARPAHYKPSCLFPILLVPQP